MRSNALITCVIAGIKYLIHPQKLGTIDATIDPDALVPVTLLTTNQIFEGNVDSLLRLYDIYDDVFVPEFGAVLVEKTPADTTKQQADPGDGFQIHRLAKNSTIRDLEKLPSGPYFLYGPNLYQAWRLYDDEFDAFTTGVIPEDIDSPDAFRPLTSFSESGLHKSIAVPSKLYHIPPGAAGGKTPLNGVRVAVSDASFIKGIPTTLSSRAWMAVNPRAAQDSEKLVKKLVSLGAVIVGKTKTGQLTAGQDWIDASAPWSPRGDHYHRIGGSSSGASAALTGYDWLRHVIGDDDRGAMLDLAAREGTFTLRPSPGILPTKGTKLASQSYSSLGLSARILDELLDITKAVSGTQDQEPDPITKLVRLVDIEAGLDKKERLLYEEFIQAAENYLGVKGEPVNITALWEENPPRTLRGQSLSGSLNQTSFLTFCKEFYSGFSGFRAAYREQFKQKPYLEPVVQELWDSGSNVTGGEAEAADQVLRDFRDWFRQRVLPSNSSKAIILPMRQQRITYRDEPFNGSDLYNAFDPSSLAALLRLPTLSAPFAQLPFYSRVSDQKEYRPVSAYVLGPRGSDVALVELVQRTYHLAQWRTRTDTGRLAFPPAKNPRNVDDRHLQGAEDAVPGYLGGEEPLNDSEDEPLVLEL